ncbi:MAG TPA: MaoC/PaaZ C-terminal domain-containing protein [Polyangiaceae bacterium]|nr:MaoC/PaaZ C-terminal domain-containing protein [Polyangiaceae bacterium]
MTAESRHGVSLRWQELEIGVERQQAYEISESVLDAFIETFGDRSAVHVDGSVARARGFADRVAHGSILNGFLSHFVGMVLPGHTALLLSVDLRFSLPCYVGDRLFLHGKVAQKSESQRVVVLLLAFVRERDGAEVASGRAQVKVALDA